MRKILIAEDEIPMAKALQLKLNNSGFDAEAVYDGEKAIEALQSSTYDVLLLDLVMPKKDGFAVLEEIRKNNISVKVIVSTNLSQAEDEKKAKELGAIDYFVKSNTSINDVIEHVKKALS